MTTVKALAAALTISALPAIALPIITLPASALAQAASPVREGKAVISGENPYVRLLDKEGGKTLAMVSFWRVHWSPYGAGHVCYVTLGEAGETGQMRVALYDNEKLYDYLTNEILAVTNKTYVERPFEKVGGARFAPKAEGTSAREETCRGGRYDVTVGWRGLQTPELVDIPPASRPNNPFGLTYLRIAPTSADITINGKPAPGKSYGTGSGLAFGETWLRR